eukprot:1158610-Pelagomonas_calceolata.AAC.1
MDLRRWAVQVFRLHCVCSAARHQPAQAAAAAQSTHFSIWFHYNPFVRSRAAPLRARTHPGAEPIRWSEGGVL